MWLSGKNTVQNHSGRPNQRTLPRYVVRALAASVAIPGCAYGQATTSYTVGTETISAGTRQPDGYEKVGIDVGDFTISPVVGANVGYDSNVDASSVNKRSDGYFSLTPSVAARSNWSSNALAFQANYSTVRYHSISINDYSVYGSSVNGRLDVSRDTQVTVSGSIGKQVEARGTEGDTLINGPPVSYRLISTEAGLTQDLGQVQLQLTGNYYQYHYNNTVVAGAPVDLAFRDNSSYMEDARLNYALSPQIALFVDGSLNQSRYSGKVVQGDNSNGLQALVGVSFAVTALISGDIGVGYLHETFNSPLFPSVNGLDYRAQLNYNVTALTTLTIQAGRSIQRSPLIGVAGIVDSNVGVLVDHELRRNILLRGGVTYASNAYTGTSQVNHRLGLNASVRYLVNRNITVGLTNNYSHQSQAGNVVSGDSYGREQIILSLTIGL